MGTLQDSIKTRKKLIQAAGELFADKGFDGVSVREIISKAGTSLNAMNYHFKTKEGLYREVLMEACRTSSISAKDQQFLLSLDPEEALFVMIKEGLKEYRKDGVHSWKTVIITRECWQPSSFFDEVLEQYFQPEARFLAKIIANVTCKPEDSQSVMFSVMTFIGLLETFGLYEHLIEGISPGFSKKSAKKDRLVKQLMRVTIEAALSEEEGA